MYATKSDMEQRYTGADLIQLTDRVEPYTNAIVDSVIDGALDDASALVDSYIAKRYDLPIASIPKALILQTCAIAFYKLHQGRYPDEVRKDYEDAISFLNKVSAGKIVLDVGGVEPLSTPADARVKSPEQKFSRESLKGF